MLHLLFYIVSMGYILLEVLHSNPPHEYFSVALRLFHFVTIMNKFACSIQMVIVSCPVFHFVFDKYACRIQMVIESFPVVLLRINKADLLFITSLARLFLQVP